MTTTHTFTLEIDRFETVDQGPRTDVVSKVYYTVWGEDNQGHRVPYYGSVELDAPTTDFVEFGNLTSDQARAWVEDAVGEDKMAKITDTLTIQLAQESQVMVPVKNVAPPWKQ
jgi:hypothetical protein